MGTRRVCTAVAACLALAPITAHAIVDLPKRKSGLWELKMAGAAMGGQAMAMSVCIDQANDNALQSTGERMAKDRCSKMDIRREGGRIVTESVCKLDQTTATTRGVFTGDFTTVYKAEISNRYDPPMMGRTEDRMTIDARWTGPCKAGMKPGDMVMPGGIVIPGGLKPPMGRPK